MGPRPIPRTEKAGRSRHYKMMRYAAQRPHRRGQGHQAGHQQSGEQTPPDAIGRKDGPPTSTTASTSWVSISSAQRVNGRWALHLRPTAKAKERVTRKLKDLTSRNWTWMEVLPVEDPERYRAGLGRILPVRQLRTGHRRDYQLRMVPLLSRLRKKHKGSHKGQLIRSKSKRLHGRIRWYAEVHEGDNSLEVYQWLPTPTELVRYRYRQKGKAGFPHPYLSGHATAASDHPKGETGPDERIYTATIGAGSSNRSEPLELAERKLQAKLRDGMKCQQCGARSPLQVHHTKGMKSHALSNLVTLCRPCHKVVSQPSQ